MHDQQDGQNICGYELSRLSRDRFIEIVFSGCGPQNLIGVGSIRASAKNPEPHLHYLAPVAVEDLNTMLPQVLDASNMNPTFLCYNTFSSSACNLTAAGKKLRWQGKDIYFEAKTKRVEELNAVVVDLDVGRNVGSIAKKGATLTAEQALNVALTRCSEGRLPVPTIVVFSGRGVQLVWLFNNDPADEQVNELEWVEHTSNIRLPVPNTRHNEHVWKQIADEIVKKRLSDLAPDKKASKTTCNWFRFPGTYNEKSGAEVTAWMIGAAPRYYSLEEMSAMLLTTADPAKSRLLFREPDEAYAKKFAVNRTTDPLKEKRKGSAAQVAHPSEVRVMELEKLNGFRGGMGEGHRYMFVYHYSSAVYRAQYPYKGNVESRKISDERVRQIVETFPISTESPFTTDDIRRACNSKPWHVASNESVADDLDVTGEEVALLGLRFIVPADIADLWALEEKNRRMQRIAEKDLLYLKVRCLLNVGWSYGSIVKRSGVPKTTVRRIHRTMKETGVLYLNDDSPLKPQEDYLLTQIYAELGAVHPNVNVGQSTA